MRKKIGSFPINPAQSKQSIEFYVSELTALFHFNYCSFGNVVVLQTNKQKKNNKKKNGTTKQNKAAVQGFSRVEFFKVKNLINNFFKKLFHNLKKKEYVKFLV